MVAAASLSSSLTLAAFDVCFVSRLFSFFLLVVVVVSVFVCCCVIFKAGGGYFCGVEI